MDSPVPSVVRVNDDGWTVHLDGVKLVETLSTYQQALEAWFSTFFIFSVEYPKPLKNTCMFLERYVVENSVNVHAVECSAFC